MDRARRWGGQAWVVAGVAFEVVLGILHRQVPGAATLVLVGGTVALALTCAVGRPWATWAVGWVVTVLLALDFGGAVGDRFGVLGPPGAPGVSWGSWGAFVDYTDALLPAALHPLAPLAATLATGLEVALTLALLLGWQRRWVGKAAAGLLAVYLVAMATALGLDEVARYAVPVLIGGALLVSTCPRRRPQGNAPRIRHAGSHAMDG